MTAMIALRFSALSAGIFLGTVLTASAADEAGNVRAAQDRAIVESLLRLEQTKIHNDPAVQAAVQRYLTRTEGTDAYLQALERFGVHGQQEALLRMIHAAPTSSAAVQAAGLLLQHDEQERLRSALENPDDRLSTAVATALGLSGRRPAVSVLEQIIRDASRRRTVRAAAAAALGRHQAGQHVLLQLVEDGQLPEDLNVIVANALLGSSDERIRQAAAKHLTLPTASGSESIPPISVLATRRGDASRGKQLFATTATCAKCHKVAGEGKDVGPDLSEIGSKLSREEMYVSILDPSAAISHNYETYTVVTTDGVVLSGLLISQTDDGVTIRNAEAIEQTVTKNELDELAKQNVSLMPADLQKALTVQDLVDTVEYMTTLKKPEDTGSIASDATVAQSAQPESREPEDATAGLDVAEGLESSLFASEPMVLNLSNLDIDHAGRVWACEIVNYRHFRNTENPVREEGDRILVLEDTDADGRADQSTVFYQGRDIDSPHGICVLGNRVIVSAGDSVFVLTDENGDLKADKKEIMFTGISGVQHDHGIHAFVFGPDGKLYFNFGNAGEQLKDAQGNVVIDKAGNPVTAQRQPYQQGMVFRCNLDGSEVETLGWNFRNPWELCIDSFGTIWQSDNDDDGNRGTRINYVMEYGNYGYLDERTGAGWRESRIGMHEEIPLRHWHLNDPGVVPNLLQTGAGSPTGILVYEGELLPAWLHNELIHCDAGPNVVRAYPVEEDGAGYTAESVDLVHGARDTWFRPADVCVAPDGSLIIADWYDPGVGGHRMGDLARGRLLRLTPQGHQGYSVPKVDVTTVGGALEAIQSPNQATRYLGWVALHAMGGEAEQALADFYQESDQPRLRARALWLLGMLPDQGETFIRRALHEDNPDLRIVGLRLARQQELDLLPIIKELVRDPSPQVRRELAIALRHQNGAEAAALWAELALQYDGQDRWYLEALGIGADGNWDEFYEAWRSAAGDKWDTPAGHDIVWRSRASAAASDLAHLIASAASSGNLQERYFRALEFHDQPQRNKALQQLLKRLTSQQGQRPAG